jgi:probable phosphomutase (TIGR03848 family)
LIAQEKSYKMPLVLLIRHGENEFVKKGRLAGRMPGVHLNEKGQQQAKKLAEMLKNAPLKAVYSSPLERTMETAEPIAAALGLQVIPRAGLQEVDFGAWQNKTLKSLRRRRLWKTVQGAPSLMRFPSGESFSDAQNRMANEIQEICAQHKPQDMIACISHSDSIKLAVAYFIGLPLDHFQRLHISPASISGIMIGENGSGLLSLNFDPAFQFSKK